MDFLIPVVMGVIGISVVIILFMVFKDRSGKGGVQRAKGRDAIIRNANRRLDANPRDPEALAALGDLYYNEENWDQAHKAYANLAELGTATDNFDVNLKFGMASLKLGNIEDAFKGLNNARRINPNNFELAYNLGVLEFQRKNYDKAIQILSQARVQDPEHAPTLRTLGHAYFRMKKNKEAMTHIRKAIDLAPDDKESLFTLAECYYEANQTEQALRVFNHLRGDPAMGASACLTCGQINADGRQYEKAIQDFELGLRHENIRADVRIELRYRLATCYLKVNDIAKALPLFKAIQAENPTYKMLPC